MLFSNLISLQFKQCLCSLLVAFSSLSGGALLAQTEADQILAAVRMSQSAQNLPELTGYLRNDLPDDGIKHAFTLQMSEQRIQFKFAAPQREDITLQLTQGQTLLQRQLDGKPVATRDDEYGNGVRNTAINYEDLSMRFLYWPNAQIMGEDRVANMNSWVIRVVNPDRRGPYHTVDVWVHKDSYAIAKMEAHDRQAKKVKAYRVNKGQRFNKGWILKQMQVESLNPETGKVQGRTYLYIDNPKS